eukprot:CCRYP_007159-RA/>CCRYP_007159-RA protein AED:0.13 eAED:1.00 QI:0/-1/0/1/-1/0/1/0/57
MTMEENLNFTSKTYVTNMASSVSRPVSRTHKRMQYWRACIKPSWQYSALLKLIWPTQ